MAKKQDNVDMDDINFDDFGDFGDGGFDGESPKPGSRKPVTTLKGSFVSGVREGLMDRGNQLNYIKSSLPQGYRSALDMADTAASNARELYDTAAKEAKPLVDNLKKLTRSSMPGLKEKLPKGLAERLEQWAGEARSSESIDPEESEIALSLGTIFNAHQEQQQKMQEEMEQRQQARDIVAGKQSDSQLTALQQVVMNTTRMVSYQDQINAQYQRKSLELQYRHYFTARKTLDVMQQHLEITKVSMETIVKNTALPDILKEHNTEKAAEIMKRKWLGTVTEPASQWFGQLGRRVMTKAKADITSFVRDFSTSIEGMITAAEDLGESVSSEAEMTGESKEDIQRRKAGETLGQMFASAVYGNLNRVTKFLTNGRSLQTVMADSKFGSFAELLQDMVENRDVYIKQMLLDSEEAGGLRGRAAGYALEAGGRPGGVNTMVSKNMDSDDLDSRQYWTLQNSRTLNDIIPGWLSKIHYEIKTGNAVRVESLPFSGMREKAAAAVKNVQAEQFHQGTGRFETLSKIDEYTKKELEDKDIVNKRGEALYEVVYAFYPYDEYSETDPEKLPRSMIPILERFFSKLAFNGIDNGRKVLTGLAADENAESPMFSMMFGTSSKVSEKWREYVRRYVRTRFGYDKTVTWDIDGTPSKVFPFKPSGSKNRHIRLFVTALKKFVHTAKGYDLERVLGVEGRGLAYSESLERLGVTARQGDEWKPERHLVGKDIKDQARADSLAAAGVRANRFSGDRYELKDDAQSDNDRYFSGDKFMARQAAEDLRNANMHVPFAARPNTAANRLRRGGRHVIGFNERANGGLMFNAGGQVPGVGPETGDKIDAKVSQGEYVVRKESTKMPGVLPLLRYLNSLGAKPGHAPTAAVGFGEAFAAGGMPGGAGGSEIANLHTMMEEKLKYSNEVLSDILTVMANIRTKPFISISAGKLSDFPDLKLNDLSGAEELLVGGKRKLMAGLGWAGGKAKSIAQWSYGAMGKAFTGAWTAATGGATSMKEWWDKKSNIYINGERTAAIKAHLLEAGEYIDVKTGKVIESIKDIKGEVKNRAGEIVISAEDFVKGFHDSRLKPALGWLKDRAKDVYGLAKKPFDWVGKASSFVYDALDMPDDIYVVGSDPWKPRLYARIFREGGYFNADDGTVIKRVGQINCAIKDIRGNEVLGVHELDKLVDFEGKPIRGLAERMIDRAKGGLSQLFKLPGKAIDMMHMGAMWAGDKVMKGWGWLKDFFSGNSSISIGLFSGQATTVNRLEQIWSILNQRLPGKRQKTPADFGKMSSIKLPDMSKHVEGAQNWFGKQFTSGLAKWQSAKALSAAKLEAGKMDLFDYWGNLNSARNEKKRQAEAFVGPMPQSKMQQVATSVGARLQELVGEKGKVDFWKRWAEKKQTELANTDVMKRLAELPKIDRRKLPADIKARYNDLVKRFQETESVLDLEELVRFREGVAGRYDAAVQFGSNSIKNLKNTAKNLKGDAKKAMDFLKNGGEKRKALMEYVDKQGSQAMKDFSAGIDPVDNWQKMTDEERKLFETYNKSIEGRVHKGAKKLVDSVKSANSKMVDKVKGITGDMPGSLDEAKDKAKGLFGKLFSKKDVVVPLKYDKDADADERIAYAQQELAGIGERPAKGAWAQFFWDNKRDKLTRMLKQATKDAKKAIVKERRSGMTFDEKLLDRKDSMMDAFARGGSSIRGRFSSMAGGLSKFLAGKAMPSREEALLAYEQKREEDERRKGLGFFGRLKEDGSKLGGLFKRKKISHDLDGDGSREGSAEEQRQAKEKTEERGWLKRMADKSGMTAGWNAGKGKGGAGMLSAIADAIPKLFSGITSGLAGVVKVAKNLLSLNVGSLLKGAAGTVGKAAMTIGRMAMGTTGMLLRGGMAVAGYGAAILTSPVTLTAAAIAVTGYAAYRGMKYLFRENEPIARFRMQQYGIDPDKEEEVQKIMRLEGLVGKITQCSQGQQAKFGNGMTADEAMAIFGIDSGNEEEVDRWVGWFISRFKPIYLSHMTVLVNLTGKKALSVADKLMDSKTKLEYLPAVHFGGDKTPYDFAGSPFAGENENHYDKDDICGYFGYYNDAIEWVKDHAEETDEEFAAQSDPKKMAALNEKKANSWKTKTQNAWNTLTSGKLLDNASEYWSNNQYFQAGADAVHEGLTKAGKLTDGAVDIASRAAARAASSPGAMYNSVNAALNTGSKSGLWKPNKPQGLEQHIINTAAKYGIDPTYMLTMAMIESGGDPTNYPGKGSKKPGQDNGPGGVAYGIYQFVPSTGKDYGLYPGGKDMRGDWMMNVDAGGRLAKANVNMLMNGDNKRPGLGRAPEPWELYMAHQQGHAGFLDLVRIAKDGTDPSNVLYKTKNGVRSLRQNMDSNGGKGKSPAEFLAHWKNAYYRKVAAFSGGMSTTTMTAVAEDKAATDQQKKYDAAKAKADSADSPTQTAVTTAASNTGSTKAPETVSMDDDIVAKPTSAAVVQEAVQPKPIVPAVAANDTPPVSMDDDAEITRVEPITVAAAPVASEPTPGLTRANVTVDDMDEFVVSDKQAREAAVAQAERERSEAMNNTSLGIDGAVRLLREQLKVNLSMDRSLTTISETLKRIERQQGGSGSSSGGSSSGSGTAPATTKRQTVAQSDPPPVSLSKRA